MLLSDWSWSAIVKTRGIGGDLQALFIPPLIDL